MRALLARFGKDRRGATSIEYALIAVGVAFAIIGAVTTFGGVVKDTFVTARSAVE